MYDKKLLSNVKICAWDCSKISQLITRIASHLAFSSTETLLELSNYGLSPVVSLSATQGSIRDIETSIPLLNGKTVQWQMDFSLPISTFFVKLGTGNRINHCQLVLSIFKKEPDSLKLVTVAKLEGATVENNKWSGFMLDSPLSPDQYICQLQSPDADNNQNTLFLWLTVEAALSIENNLLDLSDYDFTPRVTVKNEPKPEITNNNYCYVSPPSATLQAELAQLTKFPLISLIVVAEDTPYLQDCLNSVETQVYPHWELCIVADKTEFEELRRSFPNQIKLADNQTSNPYNTGLELATGEYVALIQPVDLLTEDALLEVVKWINQSADSVDMLYSDEDKVNDGDLFDEPYFKPDWAAEMLKGQMYTGQIGVYRTSLLKKIGGFRGELPHLQLWDMVLRFTAHTHHIQHIPKILYHSRRLPPVATGKTSTLKMLQAALDREGQGGYVTLNTSAPNTCLLHYPVQGQPLVSIIIPTKDMALTLAQCIESIRTITFYPHWEIIVVDNGSTEAATLALFEKYQAELGTAFSVYRHDIPFNFSKLVNQGIKVAKGEIILLLNNDTEILGPPDWLQEMIGFAQHPEVACVGGKLLYTEDNTIQHAGIICGVAGIANHSHRHFPAESRGYFDRLAMVANYSAITGACLMVRRKLWDDLNGFDENLAIAFNDIDFCLKLLRKGLRNLVLPQVTFYHYESKTRGLEDTVTKQGRINEESAYLEQRWGSLLQQDPFYNPHLTRETEDFRLNRESIYYCDY